MTGPCGRVTHFFRLPKPFLVPERQRQARPLPPFPQTQSPNGQKLPIEADIRFARRFKQFYSAKQQQWLQIFGLFVF